MRHDVAVAPRGGKTHGPGTGGRKGVALGQATGR